MARKDGAIDNGLEQKKSSANSANLHSTMSPCSRGAIARALRLDVLRVPSRAYSRQLAHTIHPRLCSTTALSLVSSFNVGQQPANAHRAFSTTRFRQSEAPIQNLTDVLPICCPGCGAFSQTVEPEEPGYYSKSRKSRRKLLPSKKDATERHNAESEDVAVSGIQDGPVDDLTHSIEESTAPKPIQGKSLPYISRPVYDN